MSDNNIIEGLLVDVPGEKIIKHCRGRAEWHEGQSKNYATKVALFHSTKAQIIKETGSFDHEEFVKRLSAENFKGDVREDQLERSGRHHQKMAARFKFFADHFLPESVYRLDITELQTLEIAES